MMEYNHLLVLTSISLIFAFGTIIISTPQAEAITTIESFTAKIVVTFDKPGITEAQISNYLKNTVWLDIEPIITNKLDNNFITYDLDVKLKVYQLNTNKFEFYPKFTVSGETTLTPQQLRNGFDSTIDNIKDVIQVHMDLQSATNVNYHLHKSFGAVNESP